MELTWLHNKQVAFTGKLASLTRTEAADLIRTYGGLFVQTVGPHTAFLIVGQEGWPLRADGSLTHKLQKADRLQKAGAALAILSEEEFLEKLGLENSGNGVHRLFTTAQLGRFLRVPRDRLRRWVRAGLLHPAQTVHGVAYFDFQQVTRVRALCDLARAGVTTDHIRRSLEQLSQWLPQVDQHLALIERDGQLLVRLEEGQLADASGQMQLNFLEDEEPEVEAPAPGFSSGTAARKISIPTRSAEDWWVEGCRLEEANRLEEAAQAYRQALLLGGPEARVCFNLGNVLYALGQKGPAAERFRQAIELDSSSIEAWNNLGNVLAELGQFDDALVALRKVLDLNPFNADGHYNLADALETLGRRQEARPHWQAYLRQEPLGPWAEHARKKLG